MPHKVRNEFRFFRLFSFFLYLHRKYGFVELSKKVINALQALRNKKPGLNGVEKALGMPQNALSGMLNGKRKLPQRWIKPLTDYVETLKVAVSEAALADQENVSEEPQTAAPYILVPERPPLTEAEIIAVAQKAQKSPPPGLDKAQRLRWHREHNQELR